MADQDLFSKAVEGRELVEIDDIGAQANRAKKILGRVRGAMLAPNTTKESPRFSVAQLAALVDLDTKQVDYRAKKGGTLPSGNLNKTGSRREFSLQEVRSWGRELRASRMRPNGAEAITIAVANFKGGVTKTTTAVTLAQGLSLRGHNVLMIDCDAQGSLTTLFGILPDAEVELGETIVPLCIGDEDSVEYAIRPTYWPGIDLIPATSSLFAAEFSLPGRQVNEGGDFQFWNVLHYGIEKARQKYDVIVIDTPPALSYVTINAMMAADGIINPLPPNALDFASSIQFWDLFYDLTKELNTRGNSRKRYEFVDVLLAKVDAADIATDVVRGWINSAYGSKVLPVEIPKTSTAASASMEFGSVYDIKPNASNNRTIKRAMDAYDQFVSIVETQIVNAWSRQAGPEASASARTATPSSEGGEQLDGGDAPASNPGRSGVPA